MARIPKIRPMLSKISRSLTRTSSKCAALALSTLWLVLSLRATCLTTESSLALFASTGWKCVQGIKRREMKILKPITQTIMLRCLIAVARATLASASVAPPLSKASTSPKSLATNSATRSPTSTLSEARATFQGTRPSRDTTSRGTNGPR